MWRDDVGWAATMMAAGLTVVLVIVALAGVGAVMWTVLATVRHEAHPYPWLGHPTEMILAQRYARGEIDAKQYWQLFGGIRGHRQ